MEQLHTNTLSGPGTISGAMSHGNIQTVRSQPLRKETLGNKFVTVGVGAVMVMSVFSATPVAEPHTSVIKSPTSAYNVRTGVNTVSINGQTEGNQMSPTGRKSSARTAQSTITRKAFIGNRDTSVLFPEQKLDYIAADRPFKEPRVVKATSIARGFLKK